MFSLNTPITDWQQRVVWIVGASSGIGLALAQALHPLGARVVVSARNAVALEALTRDHDNRLAIPLEVRDADACRLAVKTLLEHWGQIDLMIYCAGTYQAEDARSFPLSVMLEHQAINYVGALNVLSAVLPPMQQQKHGAIALVASVAGYVGLPKALAYAPTKAALQRLAEILHIDLKPDNLGVFLINPGFVETPLTANNHFKMPALITPQVAAEAILQGFAQGGFEIHFPKRFIPIRIRNYINYSIQN